RRWGTMADIAHLIPRTWRVGACRLRLGVKGSEVRILSPRPAFCLKPSWLAPPRALCACGPRQLPLATRLVHAVHAPCGRAGPGRCGPIFAGSGVEVVAHAADRLGVRACHGVAG